MFEPAYRSAVTALPADIATVGGYHIGWWDAQRTPTQLGGKSIRPALVLASAAANTRGSAELTRERAIIAAVAVEMVHDFSLLHDDIMDNDEIRRHRCAAWATFGVPAAILTGDLFLTAATNLLISQDRDAARILIKALHALCEGQTEDLAFENRPSVSLPECLHMVEGKTAALLSASCELGAWAAHAGPEKATLMRQFGLQLGFAFQLVDDLLGIWGDPEITGKPVFADLVHRKKSLPVVAALNSHTTAGIELAQRYSGTDLLSQAELEDLARLIELAGGRRWAEDAAAEHISAAQHLLEQAEPNPAAAADLLTLAGLITRRER
ncbi:geranylgeranyl pyrophosphate synthase-like protein [Nocardia brasiliensis ATCC 700358]|uniref:Geranylgeranyl pyrophosphate synthase-like protein n=1 Tax=Nocardia brasiliensis (strain ATCC 700358 / HUJEG-1) TaxID=1133849 RepID=K0F5U1_NOCB7|nr:geranylgeranyl pyrophosphate synthase-like protein [Nocardia brasiliensis ATCC 700358]